MVAGKKEASMVVEKVPCQEDKEVETVGKEIGVVSKEETKVGRKEEEREKEVKMVAGTVHLGVGEV